MYIYFIIVQLSISRSSTRIIVNDIEKKKRKNEKLLKYYVRIRVNITRPYFRV